MNRIIIAECRYVVYYSIVVRNTLVLSTRVYSDMRHPRRARGSKIYAHNLNCKGAVSLAWGGRGDGVLLWQTSADKECFFADV